MAQTYEAVYENGVFRPLRALPSAIPEGQCVWLTVEIDEPEDTLQLAAQVYRGLSDE